MPDGEIAIIHLGEHNVTAIVGRSWPGDALALAHSIVYGVRLFAIAAGGRVEGYAAEIVFLVLIVKGIVLL